MGRQALDLLTAPDTGITATGPTCNGYANWRLIRGRAKKLPWIVIRSDTLAAKSRSTKSLVLSQGTDSLGVIHPPLPTPRWMAREYTRSMPQRRLRPAVMRTVGVPSDPRYGCAVNKLERASFGSACKWPERVRCIASSEDGIVLMTLTDKQIEADNLRIWRQVEKTDPAHTKQVNQRGGFTAISANYQIMRATEVFGPIGEGWGYITGEPIFQETLMIVPVTLWYDGDRSKTFGPMFGCEEWRSNAGRVDSDAPKKAVTDALTKLLSQLGFNADVFLGRFDDSKYVEQRRREIEAENAPPVIDDAQWALLTDLIAKTNSDGIAMCEHYKIASLKEMTVSMFEDASARLRKRLGNDKKESE